MQLIKTQPNNPQLITTEDMLFQLSEVLTYCKSEATEQQSLISNAVDKESAQQPSIGYV